MMTLEYPLRTLMGMGKQAQKENTKHTKMMHSQALFARTQACYTDYITERHEVLKCAGL